MALSFMFYPKVPIILVSTPKSPSGCHLASPKSPTYHNKNIERKGHIFKENYGILQF